jgi:phage terminase large subunit-like protein
MANPFTYTFYLDGDEYRGITYREYLENKKLVEAVHDVERARLFLGRKVLLFRHDYMRAHKGVRERFEWLRNDWMRNKLKYYAPNSQEQLDFLNDWEEHDIMAVVAPNRVGKTTVGVVKAVLSGILELDKTWPVFAEHGVVWRPFRGVDRQLTMAFGSYEWSHIKTTVWPRVKEYVPDEVLGVYGRFSEGKGPGRRRKEPNFDRMPLVELTNGTILKFHAYSQSQSNYESSAYDGFMWDEQPPEALFDAVDERCRTVKGKQFFTLTPHRVEGRPDTGGGGWLQRFLTGTQKRGHSVSCYNTSLMDVPDWIYPESEKQKAFEKWIHEPTRLRNIKTLREGRARVLGEWHQTSGLVIDEFDPVVHVIEPFEIPGTWTRYRGIDHGVTNPTACLWAAVSPPGKDGSVSNVVIYREFYSSGRLINENVADIVRLSGNKRKSLGMASMGAQSGMMLEMFEELQVKECYAKTVIDSRSFGSKDAGSGRPYGYFYRASGLQCNSASGKNSEHYVPVMKALFGVDYEKKHPFTAGANGAARIYIFRTCQNLLRELSGWVWEEYRSGNDLKNRKETPRKKDDHGCTALAYMCQIPMRWCGDMYNFSTSVVRSGTGVRYNDDYGGDYRGV